jgi:hypothetical protein
MTRLQQRMRKFLNETVKYYSEDVNRRCVSDDGMCYYSPTSAGKKGKSEGCAIGRKMTPYQKGAADRKIQPVDRLAENLIPVELKTMPMNFLFEVQTLHDRNEYWGDKGLSEEGKSRTAGIKQKYLS